jgi:hypothetical protein
MKCINYGGLGQRLLIVDELVELWTKCTWVCNWAKYESKSNITSTNWHKSGIEAVLDGHSKKIYNNSTLKLSADFPIANILNSLHEN